jgi:hypothetical protein
MPKKCRPCLKWRISKEKAKEWIFFRKKFLTRLEQRKFVFLSRGKTNLASQNIGKKSTQRNPKKKFPQCYLMYRNLELCFLGM